MVHNRYLDIILRKFPTSFFRVNYLDASYVVVDRDHMKELFYASEDTISFKASIAESLQFEYTGLRYEHFRIPIIRGQLTQHTPKLFEPVMEELTIALTDSFPATEGKLHVSKLLKQTGHRMSFMKDLRLLLRESRTAYLLGYPYVHSQ